jgi:hypothetical protein
VGFGLGCVQPLKIGILPRSVGHDLGSSGASGIESLVYDWAVEFWCRGFNFTMVLQIFFFFPRKSNA